MKIEVGDRVRALEDCRMAGRGPDRYFYREGDTGSVVRFDGLGAWVKWDNNRIDEGVWYANTEVLTLIEEDTSGVDVLAVMEEAEANTYSALSGRIREARAAVVKLMEEAGNVIEWISDYVPDGVGGREAELRELRAALAALAGQPAAVNEAMVERIAALLHEEATDEPWAVAGVEHDGPDRDYYRTLARKVIVRADQQHAAVVGVEQVASAIAVEDTGVSWHDVSPRDRTHYVKLARAALAALAQQPAPVAPMGVERNGLPALMAALERADRKGYLPEAIQEAWDDLDLSCVPAVYGGDA